jgi:Putative Actinobacterial Holin-X, holin superfamily III
MENNAAGASIPELLRDLSTETATLVRQEMALVRAELLENAKPAAASAASFGATAVLGLGAFGALTAFIIAALALAVPLWSAALIVAIIYGLAAFILAETGKKKLHEINPALIPQTSQTIKDDITWAKTQPKSAGK